MRAYLLCAVLCITALIAAPPAYADDAPAPTVPPTETAAAPAQEQPAGDAVTVLTGESNDYIEADSGTYLTGDKLELKGNVLLHTESAFPGTTVEIRADEAVWDEKLGVFTVPGATKISVPAYKLELSGINLRADMTAHTGTLEAVSGTMRIDPKMFADANEMVNRRYVRFTTADPMVSLESEGVSFAEGEQGIFVATFKRARIAPADAKAADLRFIVQEMVYTPGQDIVVHNARLQASGVTIGYVPRYRYKLKSSDRILHGTVPLPGFDEDDGFFLQQSEYLRYGDLSIDVNSEYFIQDQRYLPDVQIFAEPTENSKLGVQFGRDRTRDLYRRRISRKTSYNFYYTQDLELDYDFLRSASFGVNYAKRSQDLPKVTSRSFSGYAKANTSAYDLGGGVKALGGVSAHYWNYEYGNSDFLALQSYVRLARESPWGIDYVQFEHTDKFGGSPFRFDDQFTENKLTVNKNFQLLPRYTGRVTAAYNYDLNNFDELTVGLSRELRAYYIGMNYNFARAAAGVEFALKF